jgi:hypothetical protein
LHGKPPPTPRRILFPFDKGKRILIQRIRSRTFAVDLNRYPQPYRILNFKPGAAGEPILLTQKGMQEITRLNESEPRLFSSWNIRSTSILFVDDCVAAGIIAGRCYRALAALGKHMDGLTWVDSG